ncbi:response regulator [Paracidovorax wautersii]|uniref:DNA-binding NarL/FixJ family response regulator n=1 Tax=Paracidovorax wautersii TaxID=1177982 RepID=A0ABU1IER1_9BURK|nr:response regulator [Paracidovorax wautersii]MDR6215615.1 DNA-binding NarL/FixJ family response regulator [Paracidovorax wautersii]
MTSHAILVEDSATIRDTLIPAMHELADIDVVATAETVLEALAASDHCDWGLMVLDLFLKEGSGLTVLERLRHRPRHQRIVVLTNYATPDIRERCARLGANAVFDKSTELDAFFEDCVQVH